MARPALSLELTARRPHQCDALLLMPSQIDKTYAACYR